MSSLQVDTAAGWSTSALRPDHDGLSEKKSTSTSLNLICGLQIPLILIPYLGDLSATSLPPTTIQVFGRTEASASRRVAKTPISAVAF